MEAQWLKQVHGSRVVHWGSASFDDGPPEADAIVSDLPGSICAVRTADCLPILLCAADGSEIAAIHAGWRGLAGGVVDATLAAMTSAPESLLAWIGPAISQAAFEVGHEVREAFGVLGETAAFFTPNERGRLQADLPGLARQILQAQQVRTYDSGLCTHSDPERFYSYRRDGATGRLLTFIYRP
ncbi:MAG: peptidoglycan editing factor PgeF [Woeseiaceae bacterium]|nr:peptidoglycan editing factor PgeF [Woeseiaceae bacterium]NIP21184.1 peptidoglycan editing factor PgeF [Woeseiaceae bacterium]NIS90156.1 peptidoglycan editing factor PgeF [Woeseiaceae bacterium]